MRPIVKVNSDAAPAQALNYAPPVAWLKRRSVRRRIALVLTLSLVALLAIALWSRSQIVSKFATLYWQRQCLRYLGAERAMAYGNHVDQLPIYPLERFRQATKHLQLMVEVGPRHPKLFVHERETPSGQKRLVILEVYEPATRIVGLDLMVTLVDPATLTQPPSNASNSARSLSVDIPGLSRPAPRSARDSLQLSWGQPVADDPTAVAIPYKFDAESGIVLVRLKDDNTKAGGVGIEPEVVPNKN